VNQWQPIIRHLVAALKYLGGAALVGMMVITCIDVVFRYFGRPIFGAVEIVSFMATIVLACAMPQTHQEQGHVGVDLWVRRLTRPTRNLIDALTALLSTILFGLVSWRMYLYAATMEKSGEVSMSLEFPFYILVYVVAVAFSVLGLVIFSDFLTKAGKVFEK
jgi:TRAP-type C4-dicarboxylate transport system permease small subunit